MITLSGSLTAAKNILKQKGMRMRAYFVIKRYLYIGLLKKETAFKLFDALIRPVVSYGCELRLVNTSVTKYESVENFKLFEQKILSDIARDSRTTPSAHLSFLKWTLRVPKRTSNAAVWGDTGRHLLAFGLIKHTLNYYTRLIKLDESNSKCYIRHAFAEQRKLGLEWYSSMHQIVKDLDPLTDRKTYTFSNTTLCKTRGQELFVEAWDHCRQGNRKLGFYNAIKSRLVVEPYLNECFPNHARHVALLRTSSHNFQKCCKCKDNLLKLRYTMSKQQLICLLDDANL